MMQKMKNFQPMRSLRAWYKSCFSPQDYKGTGTEKPSFKKRLETAEPSLAEISSQMCTASQCYEPLFKMWCDVMKTPSRLHRKQWEFAYILQALYESGMLAPGKKGLGFGCGHEPLPATLALFGCQVLATDLQPNLAEEKGWVKSGQHASSGEILNKWGICPPERFNQLVSFRFVDMNRIPDDLRGFDFLWSSCAIDHLGSINHGLGFVRSAMACLRDGGVAVHTTELNLSSNRRTYEKQDLCLFRRRDLEHLVKLLIRDGHRVSPFNFSTGHLEIDNHVDVSPYSESFHLKLDVFGYVCTSVGIVVHKRLN